MSDRRLETTIDEATAGARLDHWLADRFTYHSRSRWQALVRNERLLLNGAPTKPARILQAGDVITYQMPKVEEPPVLTDWTLLHEDDDLVVINKPGDLPCHPGGRYFRHTLWHLLQDRFPDCHLVNRLDRETSGLVVLARHRRAARHLGLQFSRHTVHKQYLVLVEGAFPPERHAIGSLGPDADSAVRKKQRFTPDRLAEDPARTDFALLGTAHGVSLLRATLHTGRLHQIRATLLGLGYPVVGDKLYGLDERWFLAFIDDRLRPADWERLRLDRQALHAWRLSLTHPASGQPLTLEAPVPADFEALLLKLDLAAAYSAVPPA